MNAGRDQNTLQEALIRSLHNSAGRLWGYAGGDNVPPLAEPFDTDRSLATVRHMLEELFEGRAPRDNIEYMARTARGLEEAKFYRRVLDRKDGVTAPANLPAFDAPLDEAGTLRGIIGVTFTTMPDRVIIQCNRDAWASRLARKRAGRGDDMQDMALTYEMEWYEDVMIRSGVLERYPHMAQA